MKKIMVHIDSIPKEVFNRIKIADYTYFLRSGHVEIHDGGRTRHTYTLERYFSSSYYKSTDRVVRQQMLDILRDYLLVIKFYEEEFKANDILKCRNAEVGIFLLRKYGFERFVREMHAKIIDQNDGQKLMMIPWLMDEEPITVVKVQDSTTGQEHMMRVPPSIKTCQEAVAWTFRMTSEEYSPIEET